jgi:hypothetical protein
LDEEVISAINNKNEDFLARYESNVAFLNENESTIFLDRDGILIVKSQNRADAQLEEIFPDSEVEKRLGLYDDYLKRESHEYGAPRRSSDLARNPCEILTFRENFHLHR